MAAAGDADENPKPRRPDFAEDFEHRDSAIEGESEAIDEAEDDGDDGERDDGPERPAGNGGKEADLERMRALFRRISTEPVGLRVHDVLIKGNSRTRDALIEAEVADLFRDAATIQELLRAAGLASKRLESLDIFDSVTITLDAGPPELPGTANVVINVVEAANPLTGNVGVFTKPEARSWSLEGSLKLKNLLGHGDIWNASGAYGWDQTSEISVGVSIPRFKAIPSPLTARLSLLSQDWVKFSSYKEHLFGLNLGLFSNTNHDLSYNLTWRNLNDPSQTSSKSIRRQLGHNLLSALKYSYKLDRRDSDLRPTKGYAFLSTSQIGGLCDSRGVRFFRQEFDVRGAIPFGFFNSALNVGVSAGAIVPWGKGFLASPSSLPDRFFLGGQSSPVCSLGGFSSLLGFRTRGVGPSEPQRFIPGKSDSDEFAPPARDFLGGDLAVTAFADISFDLPLKVFRDAGIHGHIFASAGNLVKLTENEYKNLTFPGFVNSFRSSAGAGIIFPTKFFRMEINYCYILKQQEHDRGKTGVQFSFSSPL